MLAGGLGLLRRVRSDLAGPTTPERPLERGIVDDAPLDAPAPQGLSFTLIATLAIGVNRLLHAVRDFDVFAKRASPAISGSAVTS